MSQSQLDFVCPKMQHCVHKTLCFGYASAFASFDREKKKRTKQSLTWREFVWQKRMSEQEKIHIQRHKHCSSCAGWPQTNDRKNSTTRHPATTSTTSKQQSNNDQVKTRKNDSERFDGMTLLRPVESNEL